MPDGEHASEVKAFGTSTITASETTCSGSPKMIYREKIVGINLSTWDEATVTLETSRDGSTWNTAYNFDGALTSGTISAGDDIDLAIDPTDLLMGRYARVVSSATQAAEVTITWLTVGLD